MSGDGKQLPVTPDQAYDPDAGAGPAGPGGPPADVPSWRLIATLAVAGALAGLLIVGVYQWAQPRILAHRAEALNEAIHEVLPTADRHRTLFLVEGGLVAEPPAGVDTVRAEKVYLGFDEAGRPVGFAVTGAKPGFQDVVELIFGYDAGVDRLLGMRVLESRETPGLGDKIIKDERFVAGFAGALAPILGVKPGAGTGADHEVDMITGATISSRTVIDIINARVQALGPVLDAYAARSTEVADGQTAPAGGGAP